MLKKLKRDLKKVSSPTKAKASLWYFKTGPGQYGEGDFFIGATVPEMRAIARRYKELELPYISELLSSRIHEERQIGLFILVDRYKMADEVTKEKIFKFYLKNRQGVNNWDLVDSSAPYIIGDFLLDKDKSLLFRLAKSKSLWDRRIAIISTLNFIKNNRFGETLKICDILNGDRQDLIHKACGWALREVGKKDLNTLEAYLETNYKKIARTTLRYAIERMEDKKRYYYLGKDRK